MRTPEMMDEYLGASGAGPVDEAGLSLLERYHDHHAASQCRYGCSACLDVCPSNVPVSDVLRSRMYAVDYGDRAQADEAYHKLDQSAAACLSCSGAPCASACPHRIPIARATRDTHRLLGITWAGEAPGRRDADPPIRRRSAPR
jgi:predicted aldo/keto reductase-like oxidoreductase